MQTSRFREDAREIIHDAVGGGADDLVIFSGSGATGAIDKLIDVLDLRLPADPTQHNRCSTTSLPPERPVVFIGPYEHHSNELPWRESIADVVVIGEDADGHIDLADLRTRSRRYKDRPLRIGSFSAASNVTGILSDTDAIARLLHKHGALSFWDFAAAAPYVKIRDPDRRPTPPATRTPSSSHRTSSSAGRGPPASSSPRRDLFNNRVPSMPGGGTVAYVNPLEHIYLTTRSPAKKAARRPSSSRSAPGSCSSSRRPSAPKRSASEERSFTGASRRWRANPHINILGNPDAGGCPSSASYRPRRPLLHHNYRRRAAERPVRHPSPRRLLVRGPLRPPPARHRRRPLARVQRRDQPGCEGIKPGWVRVNFNYFISDTVADYLTDAVSLIADLGHRLLADYRFDPRTGLWRHRGGTPQPPLRLADLRYAPDGTLTCPARRASVSEDALAGYLRQARELLASRPEQIDDGPTGLPDDFEALRWFHLPPACLSGTERNSPR